jgi:hypothetical protein
MKISTENDNNFGYEKITIVVDNIPLNKILCFIYKKKNLQNVYLFRVAFSWVFDSFLIGEFDFNFYLFSLKFNFFWKEMVTSENLSGCQFQIS